MDLGLKGKVAIVTGTGSQIGYGKGVALSLAGEGCIVVGCDIDKEGADQTAAELKALGVKTLAFKVNVANRDEVDAMVKKTIAEFGKIDILVNNAGRGVPWKPTIDVTRADMDVVFGVNLFGQFNCVQAVLPYMIERKYGKIINFSGGQGQPLDSVYSASKGAVDAWTKSIARDLAPKGVIVNLFLPGGALTGLAKANLPPEFFKADKGERPKNILGRSCTPHDVGQMIAFLVSDQNSFMVGQLTQTNL
jgi:NAD(P)-dependent dehydrogenase (short-subunit alcohol dehydrogenase family)